MIEINNISIDLMVFGQGQMPIIHVIFVEFQVSRQIFIRLIDSINHIS